MWLHWHTAEGTSVLLNADTIYGQSQTGGLGGRRPSYWMQENGIRLRATGTPGRKELRRRYKKLDALHLDLILNGHNTLPLVAPQAAVEKVLSKGIFEVHPTGACTFMYLAFKC